MFFEKFRRNVPEAMDMIATASLTTLRGTLYATLARLWGSSESTIQPAKIVGGAASKALDHIDHLGLETFVWGSWASAEKVRLENCWATNLNGKRAIDRIWWPVL